MSVDGEGTLATPGADWRSGSWLLGAVIKHRRGEASLAGDGGPGTVRRQRAGIDPYAALDATKRLRLGAAAALGEGTLTLVLEKPESGEDVRALKTGMSLGMAAIDVKGRLVERAAGAGSGSTLRRTRSGCGPLRTRRRGFRRRGPTARRDAHPPPLARESHQVTAADADPCAVTGRTPESRLRQRSASPTSPTRHLKR